MCGRLRIRKGIEVLLHAVQRLRGRHPEVRLLIVGGGEHAARTRDAIGRLGLSEAVQHVGRCRPEEVPALMRRACALVVPSIYEGMPLVILEAMASGLPVIASRVSGIPEVVRPDESGWLVDPEDIDGLARSLAEVLANPEEARRRGEVGRTLVEGGATPRVAGERWLELIGRSDAGEEH